MINIDKITTVIKVHTLSPVSLSVSHWKKTGGENIQISILEYFEQCSVLKQFAERLQSVYTLIHKNIMFTPVLENKLTM